MDGDDIRCGKPTRKGTSCRWRADRCPHHGPQDDPSPSPRRQGAARPARSTPLPEPAPRTRDVRDLAWWLVDETLTGALDGRTASTLASLLRVLASLGPAAMDREEALRTVELLGRIGHGLPPRDAAEWAFAATLFSEDALEEFRGWAAAG